MEGSPDAPPESPETRNFNDIVLVRITPAGEQVWRERSEGIGEALRATGFQSPTIKRDAEGFTEMPLWEVMQVFGSKTKPGGHPLVELGFKFRDRR